jgi:hypothetical protein
MEDRCSLWDGNAREPQANRLVAACITDHLQVATEEPYLAGIAFFRVIGRVGDLDHDIAGWVLG